MRPDDAGVLPVTGTSRDAPALLTESSEQFDRFMHLP